MDLKNPISLKSVSLRATEDQNTLSIDRRAFIRTAGAGMLATGFAGCTGDSSGSSEGEAGSNSSNDSGESNTDTNGETVTKTSQSRGESDETESAETTSSESAGTSNGDSDTETERGGDSDGTDRTTTEADEGGTPQFVQEEMGSVGSNTIDELEIVAWESSVSNGEFSVRVAVKNTGDQQANAEGYTFEAIPYDENGEEINTQGSSTDLSGKTEMGSSGIGSVRIIPSMEAAPGTVASYEIKLHCDGPYAEGVYCSD